MTATPGWNFAKFAEGKPPKKVIVVAGRRYRLHPSTAKFVAEGDPYYGTRVQLVP